MPTRGVVPIIALLVIASAFSQFGGSAGSPVSGFLASSSLTSPAGQPTTPLTANQPAAAPGRKQADCGDEKVYPCVPRKDLGPWSASCLFVRSKVDDTPRSPIVGIDLGKPLKKQLPVITSSPDLLPRGQAATASAGSDRWCLANAGVTLQAILVTVPDPSGSHLVLDFDRRIDAISAAAMDAGYVPDQFWLPWRLRSSGSGEDSEKADLAQLLVPIRHNQPGLEIFRGIGDNLGKVLFVFVVGETPTQGVNLEQFNNAVDYTHEIATVTTVTKSRPAAEIKVLGPGFSGSIPALAENLERLHASHKTGFEIVPSSATGQDFLSRLQTSAQDHGYGTVTSVLHNDNAALERFLAYASQDLKIQPEEVAILSESRTAYGSAQARARAADESVQSKSDPGKQATAAQYRYQDHTVNVTFPREIYRLRAAYSDQQHATAGSSSQETPPPQTGLVLNLKSSPGGSDDIPYFSGDQLPLSQEAIMLSIADTLNHRKVKLIGVFATDIFDTLFVLHFLHDFCPNTRLFVLDSDLLLIRAVDSLSLEGTLAVTDYPLSPLIQTWQTDDKKQDQEKNDPNRAMQAESLKVFPSRNAEVTYNGFFQLMGRPEKMLDYTVPPNAGEPLLWLTAVARNGFQPVHLLTSRMPAEKPAVPFAQKPPWQPHFNQNPSTRGYLLLVILLIALTGGQLVSAALGTRERFPFMGWLIEYFHINPASGPRAQKAYILSTSFIILAVLDVLVFLPIWRITVQGMADRQVTNWDYLVSAVSMLVVAGSLVASFWISHAHGVFAWRRECAYLALSWLVAVCYFTVWFQLTWLGGDDSLFFLHRSREIANGTSPLLPHLLLFFCFYLWSVTNLRRVHMWESRRQTIAFPSLDAQYRSNLLELEQNIDEYFGRLFFFRYSWAVMAVAMLVLLSSRPFSHVAGFEPFLFPVFCWRIKIFDDLYIVYLLLFASFLMGSIIRFVVGWAALLKILRRLERQPIRHAFDRLPKKWYSWTPLWHAGGARRTYALQTREVECLRKLAALARTPPVPNALHLRLPVMVDQLQLCQWKLLDAEGKNFLDLQPENENWQERLIADADAIAGEYLIDRWRQRGGCESLAAYDEEVKAKPDTGDRYNHLDQDPPADDDKLAAVAEEFVALRFVAFMRYVGAQLRNLLTFVVAGFMLGVASVRSYPFLAHRTIGWGLTLIFVALGVPVVIAFAQMDKDAILSRLSDTNPGKLDSAFYLRLISYGGLPLLTVLATQFPAIGHFLFSWIQPAIAAMH